MAANKQDAIKATRKLNYEFNILEMDPVIEITGQTVKRINERRLQVFPASFITFFPSLFVLVECMHTQCRGHQKYGVYKEENIAVMFKRHDLKEQQAMYMPYKTPICKPLRVPLTGDVLINGIKWKASKISPILATPSCIFDSIIACLKFLTLTDDFCLECLFRHNKGSGLSLERFIKTVLYHVVSYGRFFDKDFFQPVVKFQNGMDLKFRRVYWEEPEQMFKHCAYRSTFIKEEILYCPLLAPIHPSHGVYIDPNTFFLRDLGSISFVYASVQCKCNSEKMRPIRSFINIIRHDFSTNSLSIVLASWTRNESDCSDPVWSWSQFGPSGYEKDIHTVMSHPISKVCASCCNFIILKNVYVPPATWLLMADIPVSLQKTPVDIFTTLRTYVIGDAVFTLKFILVYNLSSGTFSSLHLVDHKWYFFDDFAGGIFKRCNPSRVNYKTKVNLRAVFIRQTQKAPHLCIQEAALH
jgi:hypothetical protein